MPIYIYKILIFKFTYMYVYNIDLYIFIHSYIYTQTYMCVHVNNVYAYITNG